MDYGKDMWNGFHAYEPISDEVMKSITNTTSLSSTIPHIWDPQLEQFYKHSLHLQQFAVVNEELLNKPGDEVYINKLNDIGPAVDMEKTGRTGEAALSPETPWNPATIVETAFGPEQIVTLRPTMKFKAVRFTKKALARSFYNVMNDASQALAYAHAMKFEMDAADALSSGTQHEQTVTAWASLTTGNTLSTTMIRNAKEIFDVAVLLNEMAYFSGSTVVCLIHPHQERDLSDDTDYMDVVKRNNAEMIFRGETAEWAAVRFIKSTMCKFYAGGTLTDVTTNNMTTAGGIAGPQRKWYFSGGGGTKRTNIEPRYQYTETGLGSALSVSTQDAADADAKICIIDYRNGYVVFDKPVGTTLPPVNVFSWGTVPGYEAIMLGARAFAVAYKQMPQMAQEVHNYGLNIGIAATADFDVKKLNDEQIVRIWTAG